MFFEMNPLQNICVFTQNLFRVCVLPQRNTRQCQRFPRLRTKTRRPQAAWKPQQQINAIWKCSFYLSKTQDSNKNAFQKPYLDHFCDRLPQNRDLETSNTSLWRPWPDTNQKPLCFYTDSCPSMRFTSTRRTPVSPFTTPAHKNMQATRPQEAPTTKEPILGVIVLPQRDARF